MSKFTRFTISIFLSLTVLFSVIPQAFASESTPDEPVGTEITVTSDEIEQSDFSAAVQKALDTAKNNASENNPYKVTVEPGDYRLYRGLRIYSNTTLSLYDVEIHRVPGSYVNMLRVGSEDSVSRGAAGYYYENIAVEGGIFNADHTVQTMIKAAHAKNFSMKDVIVENVYNAHMMEIAGIDGFTVQDCDFKKQNLYAETKSEICYEAIQLDVLKSGHIVNCRSEDLPMKNVLIEGCRFIDVPRGIGSHTAILNNPFTNITIRNNEFYNMESVAVQTLGWVNCTITDNYIEKAPRGIAVYSVGTDGQGVFLPSVLAEEGGIETQNSDEYKAPPKSNTLVAYNTIKECGSIKDPYANYKVSAISSMGFNLSEVHPTGETGSGGLPVGNYYQNGVTIKNNYVEIQGSGCRISDSKNIEVTSNEFICKPSEINPESNYYGIVARDGSSVTTVKNNYIKNAITNGIHFGENCEAGSVTYNNIDTTAKLGIAFYKTKVNTISDNIISNTKTEALGVKSESSVKNPIVRNKVSNSPVGIYLTSGSSGFLSSNTAVKCATAFKYPKTQMTRYAGNNYAVESASGAVVSDVSAVEISAGRSFKPAIKTTPINSNAEVTYSSSDSDIASVDEGGMITAKNVGSAEITAKSASGKTAVIAVNVKEEMSDTKTTASSPIPLVSSIYNNGGGVYLSWNKVSGAAKYRLFKKTTAGYSTVADTTSLSYTDSKVTSGTSYFYTVRAMDSKGAYTGSYENSGSPIKYVAPASIGTVENTSTNIKLSWNKVAGADRYRLFYKAGSNPWAHWKTTTKLTKTYSPVKSGESYSFAIISLDADKNPLNIIKTSPARKFLSKPSLKLVKRSKSGKKIKLSWTKVNGAKKYVLNVLKTKKKVKVVNKKTKKTKVKLVKNKKWKKLKTTTANTLVCSGALGIDYKYTVKCVDSSGKSFSVDSDIKTIKYIKPAVKKKVKPKVKVKS